MADNDAITALLFGDPGPQHGDSEYPTQRGYPAGVKTDVGYDCTFDDVQRGFKEVTNTNKPEYGFNNYNQRASQSNETSAEEAARWNFRMREQQSKGFLTRNTHKRGF